MIKGVGGLRVIKNKVSKNLGGGVTDFFFFLGGGGESPPPKRACRKPCHICAGIWRQSKKGSWKGWTVWEDKRGRRMEKKKITGTYETFGISIV